MEYQLRPITPDEAGPFFECMASSFGNDFRPDRWSERTGHYAEVDRSLAAWDGVQVVATTGIWSFELTVPGGSIATAGVTWVSVRPTHRRRGLLTAMMRRQLDDVHERGEALAALWASEAPIYGRFGYGCAAEGVEMRIERAHSALRPSTSDATARGGVRMVEREEALARWPVLYERVRRETPGMISRHDRWWSYRHLPEKDEGVDGYTGSRFAQYEEDGELLGYVRYRTKQDYEQGNPAGILHLRELIAASDAAYAALWQYLFGVDLIKTIHAEWRRVDEPLTWMLADPRRLVRRTQDTLFVRVVDVAEALAGRRYAAEGELVIEVQDRFCGWNEGSYLLKGGPNGATCTRTARSPDISLEAESLGAAYLGGVRLSTLARAGRVSGPEAALGRADAMFGWQPAPWIPEIF